MAFGDRFRLWQAGQQMQSDTDWAISQLEAQGYGTGNGSSGGNGSGLLNSDWYLGKNLGLDRFELLELLPGIGGRAAGILAGRGQEPPIKPPPPPPPDYTPLYVIAGAFVLVALLK